MVLLDPLVPSVLRRLRFLQVPSVLQVLLVPSVLPLLLVLQAPVVLQVLLVPSVLWVPEHHHARLYHLCLPNLSHRLNLVVLVVLAALGIPSHPSHQLVLSVQLVL